MPRLALTTCLLLGCALAAAPAPRPRPRARPPLVGEWRLTWGEHPPGRCLFRKDGTYRYTWLGRDWSGEWTLEGDLLTLYDGPHDDHESAPVPYPVLLEPGRWRGRSPAWPQAEFRLDAPPP